MSKIGERADRVREIVESLYGSVINRTGNILHCEAPADMLGACMNSLFRGGFGVTIGKQSARMAPRRITNTSGRTVIDPNAQDLMAYYGLEIDLRPRDARVEAGPHAGAVALTRPTPKFGG